MQKKISERNLQKMAQTNTISTIMLIYKVLSSVGYYKME